MLFLMPSHAFSTFSCSFSCFSCSFSCVVCFLIISGGFSAPFFALSAFSAFACGLMLSLASLPSLLLCVSTALMHTLILRRLTCLLAALVKSVDFNMVQDSTAASCGGGRLAAFERQIRPILLSPTWWAMAIGISGIYFLATGLFFWFTDYATAVLHAGLTVSVTFFEIACLTAPVIGAVVGSSMVSRQRCGAAGFCCLCVCRLRFAGRGQPPRVPHAGADRPRPGRWRDGRAGGR